MSGYLKSNTTATFNATTASTRSDTIIQPFGVIVKFPIRLAVLPDIMNIGVIRQHYSIFGRTV